MKITVLGDSILEGVRFENGKYSRLHELMHLFEAEHDVEFVNLSRFGATVDKGLARLRKFLEREVLGSYTILEFGGNDCAYNWGEVAENPDGDHCNTTPPDRFRQIYKELIDLVYKNGSWPIVCSLPPISSCLYLDHVTRDGLNRDAILRWMHGDVETLSRIQADYSRIAGELAEDRGCIKLDLRSAFPPDGDELETFLCVDGIHPNLAGQQLIYRRASREWSKLVAAREGRI